MSKTFPHTLEGDLLDFAKNLLKGFGLGLLYNPLGQSLLPYPLSVLPYGKAAQAVPHYEGMIARNLITAKRRQADMDISDEGIISRAKQMSDDWQFGNVRVPTFNTLSRAAMSFFMGEEPTYFHPKGIKADERLNNTRAIAGSYVGSRISTGADLAVPEMADAKPQWADEILAKMDTILSKIAALDKSGSTPFFNE